MENSELIVLDKVNYITDIRSDFEIKRFMFRTCGIGNYTFESVLAKLGFEIGKTVYLKRKKNTDKKDVEFYYSCDKDKFDEDNIIKLYYYFLKIINNGCTKNYYISKDYEDKNNIILRYDRYKKEIRIDDMTYCFSVYIGNLDISVKKNNGERIDIRIISNCDDKQIISELENNDELKQLIYNIKFSDSMDGILDKIKKTISISEWNTINFKYLNNNVENYCINIRKMYDDLKIIVSNKNDLDEDIYELNKSYVVRLEKNEKITNSKYVIILRNGDYDLRLEFVNNGIVPEIRNELELRKYLLNLKFPVRIDEVFKNIRDISLGDVNEYDEIFLNIKYEYHITDRIVMKSGILKDFIMTKDGYRIVYEDGNFSYENNILDSKYMIHMTGDRVTEYSCKCQNGIDNRDDSSRCMYSAIRDAKEAKVRTRKLIDEMIK